MERLVAVCKAQCPSRGRRLTLTAPALPPLPPTQPRPVQVEILSGVVDGVATGTPIGLLVRNKDQRSNDYDEMALKYRPSHADATYDAKVSQAPTFPHHSPPLVGCPMGQSLRAVPLAHLELEFYSAEGA